MQIISTKDLRNNLAEILELVAVGKQTFVVAKFGRKKAVLAPLKEEKTKQKVDTSKFAAFGIWEHRRDITDSARWIADLRTRQSKRVK